METIRELMQRLAALTAEELAQLRSAIVAESERLDTDEASVEDIALLQELAGMGEQMMAEEADRAQKQAQAQADREAARERIRALNPEAQADPQADPESQTDPNADPEADPESQTDPAAADPAQTPEPVTAAGQVRRMAARQRTPRRSPEATNPNPRRAAVLTATGALRGIRDPNSPIEDRQQLATAMAETLRRMPRTGKGLGDVVLASATYDYPPERQLGRNDAWENDGKIEAVTGPQALLATGGICAPTNVDYAVPTWATADRPLRDAFPAFQADRGGVLYVQPPDLGVLSGATALWTEATDASPGASTKPVVSIACGSTIQVYVEAISTRVGFGNMQSRFAPEQVAANTDLAVDYAARYAENNLLNLLAALCVSNVTAPAASTGLGATRDLVSTLLEAVYAYRNAHRIPASQTITGVFPEWLKGVIKADLARETAHQQDSSWNALMISDEQVEDLITNAGVNPVWHLDGQPSSVSGGVSQQFGIQGTGTILKFPTTTVFYLFPEGMIQFLDGGRLDLGIVRDSTLDATNDYETFVEVFESLAFRGFSSGAIQYVATISATGASTGTVTAPAGA
ncbi:MAG: major capsid protein [Solirubrobacteraceae bacterium]